MLLCIIKKNSDSPKLKENMLAWYQWVVWKLLINRP